MRKILLALAISCGATAAMAATAVPASGASAVAPKTLSTSQNRMVTCNKDATGKKGADRKTFMKSCLSTKAPVAASAVSLKK